MTIPGRVFFKELARLWALVSNAHSAPLDIEVESSRDGRKAPLLTLPLKSSIRISRKAWHAIVLIEAGHFSLFEIIFC